MLIPSLNKISSNLLNILKYLKKHLKTISNDFHKVFL